MTETNEELKSGVAVVDGIMVNTLCKGIVGCAMMTVETGTTGYAGGDTGHGGRTYLRLTDEGGTDMRCSVITSDGEMHELTGTGDVKQIEIAFGGDSEMENLIEALDFAAQTLRNMKDSANKKNEADERKQRFADYLKDLVALYKETRSLKGMSDVKVKHKVTSITKEQFFMVGLHDAARREEILLPMVYCEDVYAYIRGKMQEPPQYIDYAREL